MTQEPETTGVEEPRDAGTGRQVPVPVTVLLSLLVTAVTALLVNASLELWQTGGDLDHLWQAVSLELPLFLLGSLVVWLFVLLFGAVTGRLWPTVAVAVLVSGLLGFATQLKLRLRLEPIFPADLTLHNDVELLAQLAGPLVLITAGVGALALLVGSVLLGRWLGRWFPRPGRRTQPGWFWATATIRVAVAVVALVGLTHVSGFNTPGNALHEAYDRHGAHWRAWNQSQNYIDNGFVAGMLYNLPVPAMARPPGYGPDVMHRLAERYAARAARVNARRTAGALDDVNVVLVLSETFTDPTRYAPVVLAEDPIPYTRALMERTTSGNMLSVKYGGGTANVEFELLTGMSTTQFEPQLTTPFQMLVPDRRRFPSAVDVFEQQGLRSTALHSFSSRLYRRSEAYRALGFDRALFDQDMTYTSSVEQNPYISDAATFREVLGILEESEEPQLMNVVTMQNHFPSAGDYADPIPATGLANPEAEENLEHYARGLRHSDRALRAFIGELEERGQETGEETVLLFYGDHLPPLWGGSGIGERRKHETPFLVYTTAGPTPVERLPSTSPMFLLNHVLEVADAPVTPYYALLDALERRLPGLMPGWTVNPADEMVPWDELPPRTRELVRDYRMVQYDLAVGRGFSEREMFAVPELP